jgi:hypothetical protein
MTCPIVSCIITIITPQPFTAARTTVMELSKEDLERLGYAKGLLEHPGFGARIISLLGTPIEKGFRLLPAGWKGAVQDATRGALEKALRVAVNSLDSAPRRASSDLLHKLAAAATGAAGGAFGLAALPIELPVSTILMLRSIADIAASEQEQLDRVEARLACLEVFALGGSTTRDDAAETGYFVVRAALARSISEAAAFVAERGLVRDGAPALVRLMAQIASRFGVVVSQKAAAEAVPVIGAVGGAVVNTVFIGHFQSMARGHFIVRRLERGYGPETVKKIYENIPFAG